MIKKTLSKKILPLLLSVMITTVFMNIYDTKQTLIFGILALVIHSLIFICYDYFSSKGVVGKYCSILGGFAVIVLLYFMATSGDNSSNDGIDFMLWFMSSRGAVEESAQYTYTLFVGVCFFVASTVYYFTQVRYRIFVTFLILMIPFAIYAKEDEHIPTAMLLALLVLYLAVMIHCRQTAESENKPDVRKILDSSYKKSAAVFIFAVSFLAFAIPKPSVEANREYFESMIQANSLTQYLLSKLGEMSDTSGGGGFNFSGSSRRLFVCSAEEPMNLKSRTFMYYNFNDDTWYADNRYDRVFFKDWENEAKNLNPVDFLNSVYTACEYDEEFAEKYGIEYHNPNDYDLSVYRKSMTVVPVYLKPDYMLAPNGIISLSRSDGFMRSQSGSILGEFNYSASMIYYSDMLSDSEYARGVMNNLNIAQYGEFLDELYNILNENHADEKYITSAEYFIKDYQTAMDYYSGVTYEIDENREHTKPAPMESGEYLPPDYDEDIVQLAEDITKNCKSDIEKAEAIERYFYNNDYIYDLEYQKGQGENVKDFLFESHTGVCYEYCTAMVLLARAAGLPARYNEGFMMSEYDESEKIYYITADNAHAFPEVYISGYGWLGFEPTISDDISEQKTSFLNSEQIMITFICFGALLAVILGMIIIYMVIPAVYDKYFRIKLKKSDSVRAAVMIIKRLRKLTDTPAYVTADEFAEDFMSVYGINISEITDIFNAYTYGRGEINADINNVFSDIYDEAFAKIKEYRKQINKIRG
ncbi:MAG: transglutaminase family protein [Oscillospiraceae bacterium]